MKYPSSIDQFRCMATMLLGPSNSSGSGPLIRRSEVFRLSAIICMRMCCLVVRLVGNRILSIIGIISLIRVPII